MQNSQRNRKPGSKGRSLWKVGNAADQSDVTVPIYLAYCGIVAALRYHVASKSSNLAILVVSAPDAIDTFVHAGRLFLKMSLNRKGYHEPYVRAVKEKKSDRLAEVEIFRRAAEDGKGILLCSNLDDINEELRLFADVVMKIPKPTPNQIGAAFRLHGHVLTQADQQMIASETWTRLVYAFQPGRPLRSSLRRLRETAGRTAEPKPTAFNSGPTLADLGGLGPAKDWGLELARDLGDFKAGLISWDDVDTGALVSGPPGTGKTLFAEALARTCGLPIVVTSAAQWQVCGYLNDLLKAMRESFEEARSQGTALLFIDELDAIGSRAIADSQHADYKRQVINGLLELLDGFERRSGIVVIGATNHPENIDPAILRPGRLDRHFVIPLPDSSTRQQIFQFLAGFAVPLDQGDRFNRWTEGMSGAGLQQLVRDGRRAARREGMPFGFEHIVQVTRPLIDVPAEHMRVAAYHEAGHAIVGLQFGMKLQGIGITDTVFSEGIETLGGARFAKPRFPMKTKSYFLDHIAMFLGGLAAETLVFGEFTEAATSDPRSDLGRATALATKVEACFGMGSTLAIDIIDEKDLGRLRANDPKLRAAVSELLDSEFRRAKSILDLRHEALQIIAETLMEARVMSATEVNHALERHPMRDADSATYTDDPDQRTYVSAATAPRSS